MNVGKNGDRYAMYLQNRKALVDYATPLVGSRAEAEDVVQDAYLKFVPAETRESILHPGYLFQIVRNLSFNRRRRRKLEETVAPSDIPWWALPMPNDTPEDSVLFQERVKRVASTVDALPERARLVLQMYRFDGLSLKQIAEILNLSTTSVHRLLNDAMRMIKEEMSRMP
ncbi:sigma-70 family RNA polymerase sigma factor [Neorhizobium galegae]|uniref:sigma-70 family RNA polymerase sigma factor n=1 Tax=Neorhizobium galegae TaxID=399 RepID=UPI000621F04B|nr:sigma-70 family RNA polymerase sigma factor [Neorhizobium galegae]CDZ31118.1 Putative RNA polymerase sigma factor FECI protein [Neorhizobium galegae bv. officinalis]MCM2500186.1 sigma-70 family RNA polymerase sigma factor [Neorhizobium galegae]MCQ1769674.1 sigma-70 family RNA polymerase sigma factor [Neorhizobium galegae]MCQ1776269.1 sigma-70 family RNA polymerase sigma factor [Neorhizobium galegae]MCQ1797564.1 sigma-70 family RNA polymerase sigma factor [Neorhizobium galegae]